MGRAPCCDKSKVKRGPWSPEEDTILKNYIHNHGTGGNWIALPPKAGLKRCGKSCRLRWLNYLRPDIRLGGFTEEEDDIISSLYINIGSRWSVIASHLQGRTDNDIKNHWNTKLKKKLSSTPSIRSSTINPVQFSSITTLASLPKQEDENHRFTDNPIVDCSMMIMESNNSNLNSNMSSSQRNDGMSLNAFSMGNEYEPWRGNGDGGTDSGGDFLIEEFDFRQVIDEVSNFNYSFQEL